MSKKAEAINKLEELKKQLSSIDSIDKFFTWQELTLMYVDKYFSKEVNAVERFRFNHLHSIGLMRSEQQQKHLEQVKNWNISFFDAAIEYINFNGVYKKPVPTLIKNLNNGTMVFILTALLSLFGWMTNRIIFLQDKVNDLKIELKSVPAVSPNNIPSAETNKSAGENNNVNDSTGIDSSVLKN